MLNKSTSLILAVCLLVCMCLPASAAGGIIPDGTFSSDYFASYGCVISDNGSHVLHITFNASGVGICDEIGVANYIVQKQITTDNGTYWVDVTGFLPGYTRTNASFCTHNVNFQGVGGERYRVRATFTCTKTINGVVGTEHKSVTTSGCTVH